MDEVAPACGEEANSAIDTALLEDVLKANGEEHLHDAIMELSVDVEDEPPVIFGWKNVEAFVQAILAAQAQAAAPGGLPLPADPFGLPAAVNVQNFKEAVLEYARTRTPGAPPRLNITCLRCSLAQFGQVAAVLARLAFDPWIQQIVAVGGPTSLPIACVFVPRPSSNVLERVTPHRPNSLWG
jgi:hypothetical protein